MFDDDSLKKPKLSHEIGIDLEPFSVTDIEARINLLRGEIERLEAARLKKQASRSAADAFFKPKA